MSTHTPYHSLEVKLHDANAGVGVDDAAAGVGNDDTLDVNVVI